jgi:hypothetical protein
MQTSYNAGDAVRVYETPGNRARAEFGESGVPARAATVTREHPNDPGAFELAYTDGAEPATAYVAADVLLPA